MFLKDCNGTFRVFVWMKCLRLIKMDYWAEHANNKWLFGHKWQTLWNFMEQISHLLSTWDSWECLLIKIIKGKWIFMVLFLTKLTTKWQICLWMFCALSVVLRLCFFRKVFFKSDTAVALRRSLYLILWITLIFYQCLLWEFLQNHGMFWNQNITACKVPM